MKRIGLLSTTLLIFAVSLYAAYSQGVSTLGIGETAGAHLAAPKAMHLTFFWNQYMRLFSWVLNGLTTLFGGSLLAGIVILALLVELITLYSSVNIQLMQKKIHLFHKKLVDRFARGELSVSNTKHELEILYSVNERMHRRGAWLIGSQLFVFFLVFAGLYFTVRIPAALPGVYSSFKLSMLAQPADLSLPILASLAYLLHSLVKIHLKQREDYINPKQVYTALGFAVVAACLVFMFAGSVAVLLTVYFLTQLTFSTVRYILVEEQAQVWGKHAQRELIHLLRTSSLHKNKLEHLSRRFNHLPIVRYLNFHFLEEAMSMSLALFIALNTMHFL